MKSIFVGLLATLTLVAPAVARAAPATPTVTINNFAYSPKVLTITAGTTVRFINRDTEAHTVTYTGPEKFDSAGLDTGDSWTHTFTKPGTYAYFCTLHPFMKGTIVVTAR
ncbi:MAG TPA: cupredoxin family copper-binding protein [Candidatus Rubrimentiphilum sp.]|nr:cupredoxin family copper-binding protein [Candidatus Rubrimentiphilum sp.]